MQLQNNHQMEYVILLENASQVTIFKQKDHVDKMFISKGDH